MIVNASKREKEILLMILSAVDPSEFRPELHTECSATLDMLVEECKI